jgi:hypothetical protein
MQQGNSGNFLNMASLRTIPIYRYWPILSLPIICWCALSSILGQEAVEQPVVEDTKLEWKSNQTWPTDEIELRDGRIFKGLILSETDETIVMDEVRRSPGKTMYLIKRRFPTSTVLQIDPLAEPDRQILTARLDRFRNRSLEELQNMGDLQLDRANIAPEASWRYKSSPWFELESHADEELTRRAIVRIEQMFNAFAAILPSQPNLRTERLRIYLFDSQAEYRAFQKQQGLQLKHQAFYLREKNILAAGTDLSNLAQNLAAVQQKNAATKQSLATLTQEMPKKLQQEALNFKQQGRSPEQVKQLVSLLRGGMQRELTAMQSKLDIAERKNSREFDQFTKQLFQSLYHEAFHAYLENFVFPADKHDVPRWLNEGLAQVFEEGVLESGTLRLDVPGQQRLAALQRDLAEKSRLPLSEVLQATPQQFLVAHDAAALESERLYLYSWGLAYYLVIREPVLQTKVLTKYVHPDAAKTNPQTRLEQILGQPLDQFEKKWRTAMRELGK